MKKYLIIPILLFLFVFSIDKLFYIPKVKELFVKNNYNFYEMIFNFEDLIFKDHLEKNLKRYSSEKELLNDSLVFIGTSRSDIYREFMPKDIINNPFIKNEEIVKNKPVIGHIIKAGSFFHFYQLYNNIIKKYPEETVYVFELNYGSLNHNSYFRRRKDVENLSFFQFGEIYNQLSFQQKTDYLTSRLFITSTLNISLLLPFKPKKVSHDENLNALFFIYKGQLQHINKNINSFMSKGTLEGEETEEIKIEYDKFIQNQMDTVHLKFKENTTDKALIYKLIKDAGKRNLKFIFYRPKIHKDMRIAIDKSYGDKEKKWIEEISSYIKENNLHFIDFEDKTNLSCSYFTDPSHLSVTCAPEIIEKINNLTKIGL
jgi:hypothetical protein